MKKILSAAFLAIALVIVLNPYPVYAANIANGAKVFNAICSACHLGGSNVIIASKTLKKEALAKYNMQSLEAIKKQVTKGKNAMPAFGGRLKPDQIEDVAAYVLQQSEKGW